MAVKDVVRRATLVTSVALGAWSCSDGTPSDATDVAGLDAAYAATARYADVSVALADGFVPASGCDSLAGRGVMGVHFINPARADGRLDPSEPELLLYLPEGNSFRLIGIEYFVPVVENGQPFFGPGVPSNPGPAPTLFGRTFDGPMAGHNPAMPWHFDLHVWMYANNPAGYFDQYNPSLTCP